MRASACGALLALMTTACGASSLPAPPAAVTVSMREYRFDYAGPIPRGRVVVTAVNDGLLVHRLALIPLPADFPPLEEQLRQPVRRFVKEMVSLPDIPPGGRDAFAVDLSPGRYGLVSLLPDPDGVLQARKGMVSEFRVQ